MSEGSSGKKSAGEQLVELLGKEVLSSAPGASAAKLALDQVKKERTEAKVEKAKAAYVKAIDLWQKIEAKRREFDGMMKKMDKELGKAVGAIRRLQDGQPFTDDPAEGQEGGTAGGDES